MHNPHSQLMKHRQEDASSLFKCLAVGTDPWMQQFWPRPCQGAHHQLLRWEYGGWTSSFLPPQQHARSTSQAVVGCRSLGNEQCPGRPCFFLISYEACCEVENPLPSPPCPDQHSAVPGHRSPAAAGNSATPWAVCREQRRSLPLPELSGGASTIIRINKSPQINRKR